MEGVKIVKWPILANNLQNSLIVFFSFGLSTVIMYDIFHDKAFIFTHLFSFYVTRIHF